MLAAQGTAATAAPRIVGDANDVRCRVALELASAAFYSKNSSILWPIRAPPARSKIVLSQNLKDISGGHALEADPAEFTLIRETTGEAAHPTIYWGRRISAGKRVALVAEPFGWRGDIYSAFILNPDVAPESFTKQVETQIGRGEFLNGVLGRSPRWNPPIILMENRSHDYWIIDRGQPYEVMADWTVHGVGQKGLATPCRITFGFLPGKARGHTDPALKRMPPSVRKLAVALDEALGPGVNEGTSQPTAGIRLMVAKGWANAALRPWALTDAPYNTRSEVNQSLSAWARGNPKRTHLLRVIQAAYPAAEQGLTNYYAGRFRHPKQLAHHALDYMFRNYFVFPGKGPPRSL